MKRSRLKIQLNAAKVGQIRGGLAWLEYENAYPLRIPLVNKIYFKNAKNATRLFSQRVKLQLVLHLSYVIKNKKKKFDQKV